MAMGDGNGGFWDDFLNQPFGGKMDLNGDGREDMGEQWLGHQEFVEDTRQNDPNHNNHSNSGGSYGSDSKDYSWRQFCEDGFDVGVFPEDFETEEEYEEALEEAMQD